MAAFMELFTRNSMIDRNRSHSKTDLPLVILDEINFQIGYSDPGIVWNLNKEQTTKMVKIQMTMAQMRNMDVT